MILGVLALTTLADPWTGRLASSNLNLVLDISLGLALAFAAPPTAEQGKREFLRRETIGVG